MEGGWRVAESSCCCNAGEGVGEGDALADEVERGYGVEHAFPCFNDGEFGRGEIAVSGPVGGAGEAAKELGPVCVAARPSEVARTLGFVVEVA